jgi:Response regulator containing CheY-like receiver domain and AraC-type DNA-binding domain
MVTNEIGVLMNKYCKVLIVDDELIMRQGMKHMIEWEKEGFQIVGEASNGKEALSLIEETNPHCVIADMVMPVMNGIEFSKILGRKYPQIQLIMLSSYDKFDYVKETLLNGAIDYILKPTLNQDNLLEILKKVAGRIEGFHLITKQNLPYASQMEKVLLGFGEKLDTHTFANIFSNTFYRIFAIDLHSVSEGSREKRMALCSMIEEKFRENVEYAMLPIILNESILCIILNYRAKDENAVLERARVVADEISLIYEQTFFVMSRCFSNMQEIKKYYQEDILTKIENGFYHKGTTLYIVEAYQAKTNIRRFSIEIYTRHLGQSRYNEALRMFEEYAKYLCMERVDKYRMKNLIKNLLYNYLMEIEKFCPESEAFKEACFQMIDQAMWVDDMQSDLLTIVQEIKRLVEKYMGADDARIIEIKHFVANHYQEPLDLAEIAKQFNFSYNYISSYFSQMAKEGFNEYLNKIRIEHACELLKTRGGVSIAEIGNRVGYAEHSYFCRVFKKMIGETPSAYRRKMRGDTV